MPPPSSTMSLTTPNVTASQITISPTPLGRGSFGSVWRGTFSGCPVAVKICSVSRRASTRDAKSAAVQFRRETARYQQLRHPCITQFFCVVQHPSTSDLLLVTELMRGGSLFDAIGNLRRAGITRLAPEGMLRIAQHITNGLSYLHASHFSFGDLKTMNVLLSEPPDTANGTFGPSAQAKLCDFGLSRNLKHLVSQEQALKPGPGETQIPARNGPAGTFAYLAPEAFSGLPTDDADAPRRADVFALAIVLWELATLRRPWPGRQSLQLIRLVKKEGKRPEWPCEGRGLPRGYVELVERCWSQDAFDRPSVEEVARELERMYGELGGDEMKRRKSVGRKNGDLEHGTVEFEGMTIVEVEEEELDGSLSEGELRELGEMEFSVASLHPTDMSAVTGESQRTTSHSPISLDSLKDERLKSYSIPVVLNEMEEEIEDELCSLQTCSLNEIATELRSSFTKGGGEDYVHGEEQTRRPRPVLRAKSYCVPSCGVGDDDIEREFEDVDARTLSNNVTSQGCVNGRTKVRSPPPRRAATVPTAGYVRANCEDVDEELSIMEGEEVLDAERYGVDMSKPSWFR